MAEKKLDGNYWDRPPRGQVPTPSNGGEVMTRGGTRVAPVPGGVPGTGSGPAKDAPQPPRDR
jgi:hypothetical protein